METEYIAWAKLWRELIRCFTYNFKVPAKSPRCSMEESMAEKGVGLT